MWLINFFSCEKSYRDMKDILLFDSFLKRARVWEMRIKTIFASVSFINIVYKHSSSTFLHNKQSLFLNIAYEHCFLKLFINIVSQRDFSTLFINFLSQHCSYTFFKAKIIILENMENNSDLDFRNIIFVFNSTSLIEICQQK